MNTQTQWATVEFLPTQMQFHVELLITDPSNGGHIHARNMKMYLEGENPHLTDHPRIALGTYPSLNEAVMAIPELAVKAGLTIDEENMKWRKVAKR